MGFSFNTLLDILKKIRMSTSELKDIKLGLIDWIGNLDDTALISFLEGLRASHTGSNWWEELSENQKKIVERGLDDLQKGKTMKSHEFWSKLKNAGEE